VEDLVKNPLWRPDEEITAPLFAQHVDTFLRTL